MKTLPIRVGMIVAVLMLAGCAALKYQSAEPPRVNLSSLRLTDLNLFEQRFEVALRLQNPNEFALPITGFEYTVLVGGRELATGVNSDAVDLPAYGETTVTMTASTNLLANLAQFREWQQSPPDALDYEVKGRMSVEGMPFRMPFDHAGQVDLTAVP